MLLSRVVDQVSMVTSSAILDSSTKYGKNVTGNNHVNNTSKDSDSDKGDVCSSEDEVLLDGRAKEMKRRTTL